PGQGPGRPAGKRRERPRGHHRPQNRGFQAQAGRARPPPPARRLPARRPAGRVRQARPDRAGRRRPRPARQGRRQARRDRAEAGRAGRRPEPGLGRRPGRHGRDRHVGPALPGQGERRLPHLRGQGELPGERQRGTGVLNPVELADKLGILPPTPEQAAVIEAPLEPMVVMAGAGSGKSETMAGRVVWLVANGLVKPANVLGLTFTRKAAAELATRVRERLAGLAEAGLIDPELLHDEPTVSTYHSYASRLVTDHALREGLEPTMRLVTPAVSWQLASRVVAVYDGPMDRVELSPASVTAAVLELAGELSEHLRGPDDVRRIGEWLHDRHAELTGRVTKAQKRPLAVQAAREQLLPLVEAYERLKRRREVIDYGDQMALAARIAARHREVGEIERSRFAVVLLDEYQDTSHAQLVLLRSLFGGGHPVTAVGDPCQSIYGWRGASA